MRFEIEPKIGLGNFVLGMNINQVLTLIKRNGYYYKQCKIISNKEKNTPIFLEISSELITLRFNYYTQNLELIEKRIIIDNDINNKNSSEVNSDSEYYYKNKLFYMQNKNKEFHIIKYQNIAQLFGLSKVPKKLNKNKNIFLEYSGIGFYFTNVNDLEKSEDLDISADPSSVDTNSVLSKFFIFKEDSLYESLNTKNIFQTNDVLIKYNSQKGKSIKIERNNDNSQSIIRIGDNIEDVLRELKNPNYIYYANDINENFSQNQDSGDALYNQTSNKIFYLNYFKYGFDIMICNNKVNRIILHTNQIGDSKFGIYERCNFKLKLKKDYLATLLKTEDKFEENKEETNNNLKEPKSQNEIKEKRKSSSRKSSENEDIKKKDKINIKEKEEIKKNDKLKEKQNHDNKKEENQKELNSNIKNINEKEEKNKIKEKEEIKNDKQIKQLNNQKEENIDMKKDKIENKEIEKEKERNIKEENINNENKKEEKEENEIQNLKNSSSQENQKKENKEQEIEKEIENNENDLEKEEKEKKEEEISKEKEEKEKEEKEKEKEDVKVEEEKEKEEKNKEINKFEEKQQEETNEGEKKEEENKQSQKNNYTSNKNNRKRRKKHGNPPKKKNEIKSKEENEESEDDNDETKKEENENKGEKEDNKDNKDKEYISIFPWSDFKEEFLSKINYNKNLRHQKWDEGTSKIINCYFFNGLLFEVVDKNVIGTVIIY